MALNAAQKKSLHVGLGMILAASLIIIGIWCGTYLPGFVGEIFSMIAGIMWSPILLDISLFFLGLILVLWLNSVRRMRDGDEFVYLEQVDDPAAAALPAEARSAVYRDKPDPADPTLPFAAIEGALDLHDTAEATQLLFALPEDRLESQEVLHLRLRLAQLTGDTASATSLRAKIK